MNMSSESLLVILFVGLVAGWLAGQIVRGTGFGIVGDVIVGILGAFVGSWLLPQLGLHLGSGIISAIVNATLGAVFAPPRAAAPWWRRMGKQMARWLERAMVTRHRAVAVACWCDGRVSTTPELGAGSTPA